jgi:hypothetical protein
MITTQRALQIALAALGDCTRAAVAQSAFNNDELSDAHAASDELKRMLDAARSSSSIAVIHSVATFNPAPIPNMGQASRL